MDSILLSTPGNSVPDNHRAGYFTGSKNCRLRYAIFRSSEPVARGTIVLLPGRNESIEKYYETIRDFTAKGLWVAMFDWRGQGGSDRLLKDPRKGHVQNFADYEKDLEIFLQHIVLPDTRLPFFLVAHSLGSLVALSLAPRLANRIERMVLVAPFVGLVQKSLASRFAYPIARLICLFGFGASQVVKDQGGKPFADNNVTSDRERYQRNQTLVTAFPHLGLGAPTAQWFWQALSAARRVMKPEHLAQITVPTLVLAPTQDQIVPYSAFEHLARYFRAGQVIPISGAGHELLQERDIYRNQALAAIDAFIPGSDAEVTDIGAFR